MNNDLKDCVLDHIAIAVNSIDVAQKVYEDIGFKFEEKREVVKEQNVTTSFASIDENAHIELLEPLSNDGAIAKFLEKKGQGIHHVCFRVQDVQAKSEELRNKGYQLLYESAQKGANNCLVNFIHPKSTGGVLIEISQKESSS